MQCMRACPSRSLTGILATGCLFLVASMFALYGTASAMSHERESGTVESTLYVDSTSTGRINAVGKTHVQLPRTSMISRMLFGLSDDENRRQIAEDVLASGMHVVGDQGFYQPSSLDLARIHNGNLDATTSVDGPVFPGFKTRYGQFSLDWTDDLKIRTGRPDSAFDKKWIVRLVFSDASIVKLHPTPLRVSTESSKTVAEWSFPPGKAQGVSMSLALPWIARTYASVNNGDWWMAWGVAFVFCEILFVPLFFLLLGSGGLTEALHGRPLFEHQIKWLFIASILAILTSVFVLLGNILSSQAAEASHFIRVLHEVLPSYAAIGCVGAIYIASQPDRNLNSVIAFAGSIGVVFTALASAHDSGGGLLGPVLALFAVGGLGALLYWLVAGLLLIPAQWGGRRIGERLEGGSRWHRRAKVSAVMLAWATAFGLGTLIVRQRDEAVVAAVFEVLFVTDNLVFSASSLLPLALLPAIVFLLARSDQYAPFPSESKGLLTTFFLLYAFFVVPASSTFAGFRVPLPPALAILGLIVIGVFRWPRLDRLEREVRRLNAGRVSIDRAKSLLAESRRELIDRTFVIQSLKRLRSALSHGHTRNATSADEVITSRLEMKELDNAERFFQTGRQQEERVESIGRELVSLNFPTRPPLVYPALGCGPGDGWRKNGAVAARFGAILSVVPIGFAVWVFAQEDLVTFLENRIDLGLLFLADIFLREIALWLVAAYLFGCLFSWLPSGNGPLKGAIFALPAVLSIGLCAFLAPLELQQDWLRYSFSLVLFFSVIGLLLDMETMKRSGLRGRDLVELYRVRSLRLGVVGLIPLIVSFVGLYLEIRTGTSQTALQHAIESTSQK